MRYERAQEILASPETIKVLYEGKPIWIESLNPSTQTAYITSDALPEKEKEVPVSELYELRT
ncbi:Small acid-soluble spore protein, SspH [Moorella glycerini]|uniref:Small, acid-soluble spore protein H n=1 Tax=Neomoorella stamsii TaxID=1266720 RepID=A0A9X7P671_9FIRM|nr:MULTISPECIES: H-type small acid-soluble spore protein [Moorella]PRR72795.1 Small, acid-soluble spore protein H [Moorella stamsii]CEP66268.1 Small acid-soluble spore protein, SspH [Moorella glycerini]CEP68140.1 Small acid-soluble spore protein, SspH [Moorella glycerini]